MISVMITFQLKFLLAFCPKEQEKRKNERKSQHDKGKSGGRKSVEEIKDPPYVIRLEKNFSAAHIEYELIPGKCKYQVDVLCWKNAAKIYSPDGTKIFKTITKNGLTFVPVCVVHQLKEMSTEELISLHASVITFDLYTDKNKLGNAAKANKAEMFYIRELDCGKTDFVEAYTERVDISVMSTKKSVKTLRTVEMDDTLSHQVGSQKNEVSSHMFFEGNFAEKLQEIIMYTTNEDVPSDLVQFKDFVKPCIVNNEQAAKKPTSKKVPTDKPVVKEGKKQKTEKAPTKLTLQVQGEIFFTDPNLAIFKVENRRCEVSQFFVVLKVEDLLTRSQKIHLNPIVIKTMHISHFPEEVFEDTGFTDVYCKYSIPCIAECQTIDKPIGEFIRYNESHIYFTHTLSKIKLLEFLESKRLVLEIYGLNKYPPKETDENKLFGERKYDTDIYKIHSKPQKSCLQREENLKYQDKLLAYCSYDLSSLLKNVWDFREKAQLHNINHGTFFKHFKEMPTMESNDTDANCDFWTTYNMSTNNINLGHIQETFVSKSASLLKEWILISRNTSLSLEAYLLSPQAAALVLHQIPHTYKRLFLVAFDLKIAADCLSKMLIHNQKIICENLNTDNLLTGWVLDNGNNVAIYVEGLAIGYILNILQELDSSCRVEQAKICFNTDQAHEKRLYSMCNKWSGFFNVTLRVPIDDILKDQRLYIVGNAPISCLKALTKLNLLFHTRTLKQMMQYELFPTIEELASLDLEYGVPYAWKEPQQNEIASVTDSEVIRIENL